MTVRLALVKEGKVVRKCDDRCWFGDQEAKCECVCGGENHGRGKPVKKPKEIKGQLELGMGD